MLKICGAVLVFGVCTCLGICIRHTMQSRVQLLVKLIAAFELLRTEILFMQTPLPKAAFKVAKQTECTLLESFAKYLQTGVLTQTAMQTAASECAQLNAEDHELLMQIASGLGCSDAQAQAIHIDNALLRLKERHRQADMYLQNNGRLCVGAGVLGGLLVIILLI